MTAFSIPLLVLVLDLISASVYFVSGTPFHQAVHHIPSDQEDQPSSQVHIPAAVPWGNPPGSPSLPPDQLNLLPWGKLSLLEGVLAPYYLPLPDRTDNKQCQRDVDLMLHPGNLTQQDKLQVAMMVDSWGKVPDGLFFGNVHTPGMYEECLRTHVTKAEREVLKEEGEEGGRSFKGRYCIVAYLPAEEEFSNASMEEARGIVTGGAEARMVGVRGDNKGGGEARMGVPIAVIADPIPFYYATCIPSSCTQDDMEVSVNATLNKLHRRVWYVACHTEDERIPWQAGDYVMISVLGVLAAATVLATGLDTVTHTLQTPRYRSGPWRYLLTFSLSRNLGLIFDSRPPSSPSTITCLAGIRVLTMVWILICHQYGAGLTFTSNTFDFPSYQDPWLGQVFTNGWLSVDTFFFLGGLVLARSLLSALFPSSTSSSLSTSSSCSTCLSTLSATWSSHVNASLLMYLKAIVRLSPVILVVAGFSATLLRLMSSGPLQDQLVDWVHVHCETLWWKDPIFLSNYILGENTGTTVDDCLSHCWFTAVYMQLLFMLPFLLLPFTLCIIAGVAWLSLVTLGSLLVPMIITIVYNLPPAQLAPLSASEVFEYDWRVLMAPWCRASPWIIGVWTAVALRFFLEQRIKAPRLPWWVTVLGYLVCAVICLGLLGGLYPYNHIFPSEPYTKGVAVSYGTLARPTWALCVAWVVLTCHTGNAGVIGRVLSYRAWWPLSRLTLGIYLVSPVVQVWWAKGLLIPIYFNYLSKLVETLGVLFISGLVSIVLACLVQLPLSSLLSLLTPTQGKKDTADRANPDARVLLQ